MYVVVVVVNTDQDRNMFMYGCCLGGEIKTDVHLSTVNTMTTHHSLLVLVIVMSYHT